MILSVNPEYWVKFWIVSNYEKPLTFKYTYHIRKLWCLCPVSATLYIECLKIDYYKLTTPKISYFVTPYRYYAGNFIWSITNIIRVQLFFLQISQAYHLFHAVHDQACWKCWKLSEKSKLFQYLSKH